VKLAGQLLDCSLLHSFEESSTPSVEVSLVPKSRAKEPAVQQDERISTLDRSLSSEASSKTAGLLLFDGCLAESLSESFQ
jgi:hypothetical protein